MLVSEETQVNGSQVTRMEGRPERANGGDL
jgi:hypothetical protein